MVARGTRPEEASPTFSRLHVSCLRAILSHPKSRKWAISEKLPHRDQRWVNQADIMPSTVAKIFDNYALCRDECFFRADNLGTFDYPSLIPGMNSIPLFWHTHLMCAINPLAPVAQKIADEVVFRRFQGVGVEFFKIGLHWPPQIFDAHLLENSDLSPSRFHFSVGLDWREKKMFI